jgi:IS5 family transposase
MGPKPQTPQSGDLFRFPLAEHLNPKHELVLLGDVMDCSDEIAVNTWVENPYWQFFTGETYLQI